MVDRRAALRIEGPQLLDERIDDRGLLVAGRNLP